jgi:hypothetical protein
MIAPPVPGRAELRDASYIQRFLWTERQAGRGTPGIVRALRLCGRVDAGRLAAAAREVTEAVPLLRAAWPAGAPALTTLPEASAVCMASAPGSVGERDQRCTDILCADRDRLAHDPADPLARFHLIRCDDGETVLGLVADPLILDLRSLYLVLGAVMQAYFGRFRAAQYPAFAEVAGVSPVAGAEIRESRLGWWSRRLPQWEQAAGRGLPARDTEPTAGGLRTTQLSLPEDRWTRLAQAGGSAGNSGSLAVIALLTWWFGVRKDRPRAPIFGSTLDLRDYGGLGPVIGPLTDRIAFAVDIEGLPGMTFADLAFRAHAGLLDAVVHYLPYQDIVTLGRATAGLRPASTARLWDVAIHYCRTPPASSYTRGEETLARQGLSIELFRESMLASAGTGSQGAGDGTAMEIHLAESGTGMALVVNFDPLIVPADQVTGMLSDLDHAIDAILADPQTPLSSL